MQLETDGPRSARLLRRVAVVAQAYTGMLKETLSTLVGSGILQSALPLARCGRCRGTVGIGLWTHVEVDTRLERGDTGEIVRLIGIEKSIVALRSLNYSICNLGRVGDRRTTSRTTSTSSIR